jgi:hypothetical protein
MLEVRVLDRCSREVSCSLGYESIVLRGYGIGCQVKSVVAKDEARSDDLDSPIDEHS